LWLTNQKEIMGTMHNGPWPNAAAGLGFLLFVAMSWYVATEKVWLALQALR
jgi:hypothetical protein